jgi:hypothetical protein
VMIAAGEQALARRIALGRAGGNQPLAQSFRTIQIGASVITVTPDAVKECQLLNGADSRLSLVAVLMPHRSELRIIGIAFS